MGQHDCLQLLLKQKEGLTITQISEKLELGRGSVTVNIGKLYKEGLLTKSEILDLKRKKMVTLWKIK